MQIIRFGLVGIINTIIDFGILNGLLFLAGYPIRTSLVFLNSVAFLVAGLNSFLMNKNWTFADRGPASLNQFGWFMGFTLVGMGINSLVVYLLTTPLISPPDVPVAVWVNAAKVVATLASMVWNFSSYRKFVFGRLAKA